MAANLYLYIGAIVAVDVVLMALLVANLRGFVRNELRDLFDALDMTFEKQIKDLTKRRTRNRSAATEAVLSGVEIATTGNPVVEIDDAETLSVGEAK